MNPADRIIESEVLGGGASVRLYPPRHHMSEYRGRQQSSMIVEGTEIANISLDNIMSYAVRAPDEDNTQKQIGQMVGDALTRGQGGYFWDADAFGREDAATFNYSFFPVVFLSGKGGQESVTVAPYICIYSDIPMNNFTYSVNALQPQYRRYGVPTATSTSGGRMVYLDTRYIRGDDAWASFITAMSNTAVQEDSYITVLPFVSEHVFQQHITFYQSQEAWSFSGTSFGLAMLMATMGAPPVMYAGFIKSIAGDGVVTHDQQGWQIHEVPRMSTIVESVQYLDFKALWASQFDFPFIMPAVGFMRESLLHLFQSRSNVERVVRTGQTVAVEQMPRRIRAETHPFLINVAKLIYTNAQLEAGQNFSAPGFATPLLMSSDPLGVIVLAGIAYVHFAAQKTWDTNTQQQRYAAKYDMSSGDYSTTNKSYAPIAAKEISTRFESRLFPLHQEPPTPAARRRMLAEQRALAARKNAAQEAAAQVRFQARSASVGKKKPRGLSRAQAFLAQTQLEDAGGMSTKEIKAALRSDPIVPHAALRSAQERGRLLAKNPAALASQAIMKLIKGIGSQNLQLPPGVKHGSTAGRARAIQMLYAAGPGQTYVTPAMAQLIMDHYDANGNNKNKAAGAQRAVGRPPQEPQRQIAQARQAAASAAASAAGGGSVTAASGGIPGYSGGTRIPFGFPGSTVTAQEYAEMKRQQALPGMPTSIELASPKKMTRQERAQKRAPEPLSRDPLGGARAFPEAMMFGPRGMMQQSKKPRKTQFAKEEEGESD